VRRYLRIWLRDREVWGALLVAIGFAVSRLCYHAHGVTLDTAPVTTFDQLIDPSLLQTRFWQSLFYMSGQPPLYNVLTAIALKLSPETPAQILVPAFWVFGLYAGLCLYVILLRLRIPVLIAAAVAIAILVTPTFVLYENWYFYPHLNVTWILGGIAWLAASRGRPGIAMAISAAHFGGLVLTRSLFHPLFLGLLALATAACVAPGQRRRALACFVLPALLVIGWCAKNQVLFGFFGTSAWASRNVNRSVKTLLGDARIAREARRGLLSAAVGHDEFDYADTQMATFGLEPRTTGIPILDQAHKPTASSHDRNYNHWAFPATAKFYWQNVRVLLAAYPATYLRGIWSDSVPAFFRPVDDDYYFFRRNRGAIPDAVAWFQRFEASNLARAWVGLGLLLAIVAACAPATPRPMRVVLVPALAVIAWVLAVGLIGEIGENNRFRYKILWLSWALAVAGYGAAVARLASWIADVRWRRRALQPAR
jgi:hypothetical protein